MKLVTVVALSIWVFGYLFTPISPHLSIHIFEAGWVGNDSLCGNNPYRDN